MDCGRRHPGGNPRTNGEAMVQPGLPHFKLWPEAVAASFGDDATACPAAFQGRQTNRPASVGVKQKPAPLSRLYVLDQGTALESVSMSPSAAPWHSYAIRTSPSHASLGGCGAILFNARDWLSRSRFSACCDRRICSRWVKLSGSLESEASPVNGWPCQKWRTATDDILSWQERFSSNLTRMSFEQLSSRRAFLICAVPSRSLERFPRWTLMSLSWGLPRLSYLCLPLSP